MKAVAILLATLAAFAAGLLGIKMVLNPGDAPEAVVAETEDAPTAAEALEEATGAPTDTLVTLSLPDAPIEEVERLRAQIELTQQQLPVLLEQLYELEQQVAARQERYQRATEVASSVSKLEGEELRDILVHLDGALLTDIYVQASPRSRTKLLQALPAPAAAALIEWVTYAYGSSRPSRRGSAASATPVSSPDSTSRPAPTASR